MEWKKKKTATSVSGQKTRQQHPIHWLFLPVYAVTVGGLIIGSKLTCVGIGNCPADGFLCRGLLAV